MQVLCLSAFLVSLQREEEHSQALFFYVTLSSLSGTPSCLASEQFLCLADTSSLACLPADFTTDLNLPGIIVLSAFIHRFHVKIVATATAAVFTKCHCQYFILKNLKFFLQNLIYTFLFLFLV